MTDKEEPRLYVNRWGDTSDPAPERRGPRQDACSCFDGSRPHPRARVGFHTERQDTSAPGWQHLLELVDEAAADGCEEFYDGDPESVLKALEGAARLQDS
jgi:hypothetical protein